MDVSKLKSFALEINGQYKTVYNKDEADDVINGLLSKLHQESHSYDILFYRYKKLEELAEKLREENQHNERCKNTFQIGKNILQAETEAYPEIIARGHLHYTVENLLGNALNKAIDEISKSVAGDIRCLRSSIELQPFLIQLFVSENTIKNLKNEIIWCIATKDRKFRKYLKNDAELEKLGFRKT